MPDPEPWIEKRTRWTDTKVAHSYDAKRFRTRLQRRKHENDVRLVNGLLRRIGPNLRVLDAPTGTGRMLSALERYGHRPVGIDLSYPMLQQHLAADSMSGSSPRSEDRSHRVLGDIEKMPFKEGAFDAVVSLRFLFHAEDRDIRIGLMAHFSGVAPWLIGHVRSRDNGKYLGRKIRHQLRLTDRFREAPSLSELREELSEAGYDLVHRVPVSRLFSDKSLFLARRIDVQS